MSRFACAVFALLLVGCTSGSTAPYAWVRAPGWIEPTFSSVQAVVLPAQVHAGVEFTVTVNTLGSSSCTRVGSTDVDVRANAAAITPYNWEAPAGSGCTRDLMTFPHAVKLRLAERGEAVLRIHGRDRDGAGVVVEFPVVVQ